jgi:hypothetical protein
VRLQVGAALPELPFEVGDKHCVDRSATILTRPHTVDRSHSLHHCKVIEAATWAFAEPFHEARTSIGRMKVFGEGFPP